ncbi:hypothetical protein AB6A68_05015 [Ferrimicrobium acidiphilum]|uniref:ABC transporter substrate-binding protein n=3 Tax=Ferrimicrobium TaxID=121038 RepID=A0ABV3Y0X0_9ACTN|nr:hypothetical protein [Ferrimicrobium sp.]
MRRNGHQKGALRSRFMRCSFTMVAFGVVGGSLLAACGTSSATSASSTTPVASARSFQATHFTTNLSKVCPNPLIVQTNWLPEPDHGALWELIGAGGKMAQYTYTGPLGSTGIKMEIIAGGPGDNYLPEPTALYAGNPVIRVTPDLGMGSLDTVIQLSKKFPAVGVVALQEHDPLVFISDPKTFPNLSTIHSLIAAAKKGAHFYVASLQTAYVQFLISKGVPESAFIGGYAGDLAKFATGNGMIIQQGYATSEVYNLQHNTPAWNKPVHFSFISHYGLNDYDEVVEVAKNRLPAMSACLTKLVPMIQQAAVDYIQHPSVVNKVLNKFNSGGFGASYWSTSLAYSKAAVRTMLKYDLVGNSQGGKGPIGGLNLSRIQANISTLVPIYAKQGSTNYLPGVSASDVATNRFIDPSVKLPG